ncbi:MAG: 2-oxo acid dehydrogenase subunit E2 [Verrucomicrobiota bacterium]
MDVKLPPLGEGADSGTVVNILVKEGDAITKGQTIIELETGKAVTPISSSAAGQVSKIIVKEGQKISVGTPILSLAGNGAAVPASETPKKAAPNKAPVKKSPKEEEASEEVEEGAEDDFEYTGELPPPASPSLRRLAQDLGIDLRKVRGSEGGGRIVLGDLKGFIQNLQRAAKQKSPSTSPGQKSPAQVAPQIDFSRFGSIYKRPMTELRKVIAQRMTENWNAIPHVTQFDEVDLTVIMELRKKYADAYEKKGAKLTVTSFAIKALLNTLKKHPHFNTSLDEASQEIIFKEYFHLGIAVDTEQGLMVPVIRDADKKDLVQLSKEMNDLAVKARERKISMDELQGGTFTISNQGAFGGAHFTPIVNKPEVAILGMGKGAFKPIATKDKKVEVRLMLPITLSYDHRVIDGGSAARFMVDLVAAFEAFDESVVKI